jgi:hypothetical protein
MGEGVEDRKDGTREEDRGAASSLYPGRAARGRQPRSGVARPEEAAHRNRDHIVNYIVFIRDFIRFKPPRPRDKIHSSA